MEVREFGSARPAGLEPPTTFGAELRILLLRISYVLWERNVGEYLESPESDIVSVFSWVCWRG